MKKTLIALSVLVAAGSVNAATMYQAEGLSVDVFADFDVDYEKSAGVDKEAAIRLDDSDFGFSVTSEVNDNFKVLGYANWDGGDRGASAVTLDNGWAGVQYGDFTVKAGRLNNFMDDVGVDHDQAIGGSYEGWNISAPSSPSGTTDFDGLKNSTISDKTDQVVKVSFDNGEMFYAGIALTQNKDGKDTNADDFSQFDGVVGVRAAGADIALYYASSSVEGLQSDPNNAASDKYDVDAKALVLQAKYSIDAWTLGALYGKSDIDLDNTTASTDSDADISAIALSAKYTMDKTTFGVAWSKQDNEEGSDFSQWYANATYKLTSNAKVYVEIADKDEDKKGEKMGYAAGLKVSF